MSSYFFDQTCNTGFISASWKQSKGILGLHWLHTGIHEDDVGSPLNASDVKSPEVEAVLQKGASPVVNSQDESKIEFSWGKYWFLGLAPHHIVKSLHCGENPYSRYCSNFSCRGGRSNQRMELLCSCCSSALRSECSSKVFNSDLAWFWCSLTLALSSFSDFRFPCSS